MYIKELSKDEFDLFTNTYDIKSIYQTSQYANLMKNEGYDYLFVGLIDNNTCIAASLILILNESKFKYGYVPRGFLIDYNNSNLITTFTKLIKDYLNKKGVMAIKINPPIIKTIYDFNKNPLNIDNYENIYNTLLDNSYKHLGYNNFFEALKPRFEAIIDLNLDINTLFKNVKKEYRTKIRSAISNGVKVYKGNLLNLDTLYKYTKDKYKRSLDYFKSAYGYFYENNMIDIYITRLDTETYLKVTQQKLAYYESLGNILNKKILSNNKSKKLINKKMNCDKEIEKYKNQLIKATSYLRTYKSSVITSVCVLIKQNDNVTILIDGYDEEFKKLNSKHLLIWQLIDLYKKQGFKKFNLGGMSNALIDNREFIGLNNFKLGFGAKMYEYLGDFELITNKINYNLYRNYVPLKNLIKEKLK